MRGEEFQFHVGALAYGKQLPGARYIFRPKQGDVPDQLYAEIRRAEIAAQPAPDWNLLKLHTGEFGVTFLSYPDFDGDPHPALAEATKINLNTGAVTRTDYRSRTNPPILHRKETFLPVGDPRIPVFAALTTLEEEAGLYRDPTRIGLRVQWLALLKRLGLSYEGHELVRGGMAASADRALDDECMEVKRHRTAIKRYDLSKPVKQLLERGLLRKGDIFSHGATRSGTIRSRRADSLATLQIQNRERRPQR
jgi:hypothetical protein